jgi:phosphoadenosine phosphosulfate reductase
MADLERKVTTAIDALHQFQPKQTPYYLAFSGGKDSIVVKHLAEAAQVPFDAYYNATGMDPYQIVLFIRKHHADVHFTKPKRSFFHAIVSRGFPLRTKRWCCEYLKESQGNGRVILTGIRAQESTRRAHRRLFEACLKRPGTFYLHPLLNWSYDDVWNYIKTRHLPYCQLYDHGYHRIGCLFCPFASAKINRLSAKTHPGQMRAFVKAFERLLAAGRPSNARWNSGEEMFRWWAFTRPDHRRGPAKNQCTLFD